MTDNQRSRRNYARSLNAMARVTYPARDKVTVACSCGFYCVIVSTGSARKYVGLQRIAQPCAAPARDKTTAAPIEQLPAALRQQLGIGLS